MAAASFAALEARLNAAVFARLSNTDAVVDSIAVVGIFDTPHTLGDVGMIGMTSTQPVLTVRTADLPVEPVGKTVVVGAVSYLVAAHEPDGTGISRLVLESAA